LGDSRQECVALLRELPEFLAGEQEVVVVVHASPRETKQPPRPARPLGRKFLGLERKPVGD
jgi:hypothetical protein